MKVSELQPKEVFDQFIKIAAIPRGSGNTQAICQYCMNFAKERGYKSIQDEAGNVMIFAPGTKGFEESQPVILQAHLDMVCDQDPECSLDMTREGLELDTDGKYLWADGTTLGGDDGIAVAYILALLNDDTLPHPPIEVIFTIDEEVGMLGARALDTSHLTGKRVINIDSEEEGILYASCAGGVRAKAFYPFARNTEVEFPENVYELRVYGLSGGHSGMDINKKRLNAIKLLAKIVLEMEKEDSFSVAEIHGGVKDNAIPSEASAIVCFHSREEFIHMCEVLESLVAKIKDKITENIDGLRIQFFPADHIDKTSTVEDSIRLMESIAELPTGVWKMSQDIPNMVETSLNLAVAATTEDQVELSYFLRSNVDREKEFMRKHLDALVAKHGATIQYRADYSAWEYKENSPLRDMMIEAYEECFGTKPQLASVHGGLECGILSTTKLTDADFISFGPTMYNVHTPNEKLDVASAGRCWKYLLKVMEKLG